MNSKRNTEQTARSAQAKNRCCQAESPRGAGSLEHGLGRDQAEEHQDQDEHRVFEDRDEPPAEERSPSAGRAASPATRRAPRRDNRSTRRVWRRRSEAAPLRPVGVAGSASGTGSNAPEGAGPPPADGVRRDGRRRNREWPGSMALVTAGPDPRVRAAAARGRVTVHRRHEMSQPVQVVPDQLQPLDRAAKRHVFQKGDRLTDLVEGRLGRICVQARAAVARAASASAGRPPSPPARRGAVARGVPFIPPGRQPRAARAPRRTPGPSRHLCLEPRQMEPVGPLRFRAQPIEPAEPARGRSRRSSTTACNCSQPAQIDSSRGSGSGLAGGASEFRSRPSSKSSQAVGGCGVSPSSRATSVLCHSRSCRNPSIAMAWCSGLRRRAASASRTGSPARRPAPS